MRPSSRISISNLPTASNSCSVPPARRPHSLPDHHWPHAGCKALTLRTVAPASADDKPYTAHVGGFSDAQPRAPPPTFNDNDALHLI